MSEKMHPDDIRTLFSTAMSDMYREEVPQYGTLIDLVQDVNAATLAANPDLRRQLEDAGELSRLSVERHGAIRVGTAEEINNMRRIFAVMGMYPVGYYDLSVAGLPVHSTAFRPIEDASLSRNPFRVFCSLIRLDLLEDQELAREAEVILSKRQIVTDRALELLDLAEAEGGLTAALAQGFVTEALETFRWHSDATVSAQTYAALLKAHRLIADVVCFRGPHINHLTPRTLDIDAVQKGMPERGITPKAIVEGPPQRAASILLRQTSFKALEEDVSFDGVSGTHTARFGEIEQRGVALKPAGRALYDDCLAKTRARVSVGPNGERAEEYMAALAEEFAAFPDDLTTLRRENLAYFRFGAKGQNVPAAASIEDLIASGDLIADPQTYEDFLPVSAAGIFQSNLGSDEQSNFGLSSNQEIFEAAIQTKVFDEQALYAKTEAESLKAALDILGQGHLVADVLKVA
ncbi:VOC family protein [Phaeobacter sp. HF9A]|uniref:2-oxoadipate dioxygenase/decarboxylase HglS n=1 Tax=Phaeobacter sp. HF9A TaxID=2721561 RepID=UPI0014312263|nr:VOC family protein [Phaeobacter sp. HF9A]NIZ12565.1 VOC family protein [Phaeobacter sp. HF9A]